MSLPRRVHGAEAHGGPVISTPFARKIAPTHDASRGGMGENALTAFVLFGVFSIAGALPAQVAWDIGGLVAVPFVALEALMVAMTTLGGIACVLYAVARVRGL